eukprot:15145947-Alexandrium_andersonii.AAC.1
MSASLVGSEMCIRDRLKFRTPQAMLHFALSIGRNTQPVILVSDQRAVSYTHLTLPTICSV